MQSKFISRAGVSIATIAMGAAASLAAASTALADTGGAPAQAPTVLAAANTCPTWTATGNEAILRTGAGTKHRAIGQLYRNDRGKKITSSGSWTEHKVDKESKDGLKAGNTDWVAKAHLDQRVYVNLD